MAGEVRYTIGHELGDPFVIVCHPTNSLNMSTFQVEERATQVDLDNTPVIRLVRSESIPEDRELVATDSDVEWFMDCRNPDGSAAAFRMNGIRVGIAALFNAGLVTVKPGDRIAIGTRDGVKDVQVGSNGMFRVDLGRWRFVNHGSHTSEISLGGLHSVTVLDSAAELDGLEITEATTTNHNDVVRETIFVAPEEPLFDDGIGRIRYRVFRSGVGEVASSGTGAAAAALAIRRIAENTTTHNWRAESRGGSVGVQMFPTEDGEHVSINGAAETVTEGTFSP